MQSLKSQFLIDPDVVFLNHGSFGATPRPVFESYQRWQRELERQPVEFLGRRHDDLMRRARGGLADYLATRPENVVFTQNATISVNMVARSLELGPGDEVLASDHEYGACDRAWRFVARERRFAYINRAVALPPTSKENLVDEFWVGVTPRTRLIFLSHITSPTAMILPVAEICRRARQAGILTLVDGAHAPGQFPLDLGEVGADYYAGNLHKWLCAPKGAGFLYAAPEAQSLLKPLVVSWGYEAEVPSGSVFIDHNEWWGTRDIAAFLAVEAAISFQEEHDWLRVRAECHDLLNATLTRIGEVTHLAVLYPDDSWYAQMGAAALPPEIDTAVLRERLYIDHKVEIPIIDWHGRKLIRVSIQGYNDESDIDRLITALRHLL